MDKYEYKVRADEIKELIACGEYVQAAEIADTIDWRRVKSVMMLCTISDLYKINRRYEDAKNMLLLAYERRPGGRTICYSLCELCIKTEEFGQAVNYYKEFVQVAPKDSGRYILQYKLYEAQDVNLEERIGVLEELKKRDYREKWAYELAYLYHRVGLATRCVEECDELILWFGEGKYVVKAMELKMLHEPLTAEQQSKYDRRFENTGDREAEPVQEAGQPIGEQEGLTEQQTIVWEGVPGRETAETPGMTEEQAATAPEDMEIQVNVGQFNTINLQAELAEGLREVLGNRSSRDEEITRTIMEPMMNTDTESLDFPEIDEVNEEDLGPEPEEMEGSEIFFGETADLSAAEVDTAAGRFPEPQGFTEVYGAVGEPVEEPAFGTPDVDETAELVMSQMRTESEGKVQEIPESVQPPEELARVLSQESDGQIRLVVPENESIEKQITGQMSIEDILTEWERMKRENEEKRKEEVRQHVLQQTGNMFTEFEAAVRDGLLEQLEQGAPVEEESFAEAETAEETATEEENSEEENPEEAVEEESSAGEAEEFYETEEIEEIIEPEEENFAEEEAAEEENPEEAVEEEGSAGEAEEFYETEEAPVVVERDKVKPRELTREEKELYAPFIQSRASKEKLVKAIDNISMAAYTGNLIITGDEGMDTVTLAKNMIREIQMTDSNFSGKVAKVSGEGLNNRNVSETLERLKSGALIVQKASGISADTAAALQKALQQESLGIVVVLEDTKKAMNKFLAANSELADTFTARVDVEALSNDTLVSFGRQYAKEREYSIDELGILALHTRIEELQTIDHAVTVIEVKEIVDEAIRHADRKNLKHFFDILFAKRYDDEDMIILTEKDFA